jgi:hypothetical protein
MANVLPGIRGVLIIVLGYLLTNVLFGLGILGYFLFGYGEDPGFVSAYMQGLYDLPENRPFFIQALIDGGTQIALTGIWLYAAWLFVRRKKAATYMLWNAVAAGLVLLGLSMLLAYVLGGLPELPRFGGTSLVVALGVQQMFDRSPRTRAVFVN